jgi:hypothetical protein
VLVVGSEAEWPAGVEYDPLRLGLRDPPSNISNAVGFVGGVLTKRLPYENCEIEVVPPSADYCRLRYDSSSVTIRGTVTDTLCGFQPAIGVTVRLRETEPPRGAPRLVRSTLSNHLGQYQIGALEAGKRYALSFSRLGLGRTEEFEDNLDTLTFAPGEVATYDAGLRRLGSCTEEM